MDLRNRRVVINDWAFKLAQNLKVSSKYGNESDFAVKEGEVVAFNIDPRTLSQEQQTVLKIEILPEEKKGHYKEFGGSSSISYNYQY